MIEIYGCDYFISGLFFDILYFKLKVFFEFRIVDGFRYDIYVLYYSGYIHGLGEWVFVGKFIFVYCGIYVFMEYLYRDIKVFRFLRFYR